MTEQTLQHPLAVLLIPQPTGTIPAVRRLTGPHPIYRFERVWMRGVDTLKGRKFVITDPGIYEICEPLPNGRTVTSYLRIAEDGEQSVIERPEVNAAFPKTAAAPSHNATVPA